MTLLAAAIGRGVSRTQRRAPVLHITKRCLGETVVGPAAIADFSANWMHAQNFFCKDTVGYYEFRQQCQSLRLFVFAGVCGGCCFSLFWNPPKSSYWIRYSPMYAISNIKNAFISSSPPVFLAAKAEHDANVPDIVNQLVTTRRLVGAEDEEEEH